MCRNPHVILGPLCAGPPGRQRGRRAIGRAPAGPRSSRTTVPSRGAPVNRRAEPGPVALWADLFGLALPPRRQPLTLDDIERELVRFKAELTAERGSS